MDDKMFGAYTKLRNDGYAFVEIASWFSRAIFYENLYQKFCNCGRG